MYVLAGHVVSGPVSCAFEVLVHMVVKDVTDLVDDSKFTAHVHVLSLCDSHEFTSSIEHSVQVDSDLMNHSASMLLLSDSIRSVTSVTVNIAMIPADSSVGQVVLTSPVVHFVVRHTASIIVDLIKLVHKLSDQSSQVVDIFSLVSAGVLGCSSKECRCSRHLCVIKCLLLLFQEGQFSI